MVTLGLLGLTGCATPHAGPRQPWRFEARPTHGVVRVLPVIVTAEPPELTLDGYIGAGVPWRREWLRRQRLTQVEAIPTALGLALPASVNGILGHDFDGHFLQGRHAPGSRGRIAAALRGKADLDEALAGAARGESVLVSWVTHLEAHPLTDDGFAGEIVQTDAGPVVLDLIEEPTLVEVRFGMALVAPDGEVVLRYTDASSTVVSARQDGLHAATELADALALEVAKVWALDPRLEDDGISDPDALVRW